MPSAQTRLFKNNKSQAVRLPKAVEMAENISLVDLWVSLGMSGLMAKVCQMILWNHASSQMISNGKIFSA